MAELTPAQKERAKELALKGWTRAQIAAELGVTRGQIAGTLWRQLGRGGGGQAPSQRRSRKMNNPKRPKPKEIKIPTDATHCTLEELRPNTCRWPIGEPSEPTFRFCGAECPVEKSYCDHHQSVAIRRTDPRDKTAAGPRTRPRFWYGNPKSEGDK